jgi:ADP-ribosylglycohydrolase
MSDPNGLDPNIERVIAQYWSSRQDTLTWPRPAVDVIADEKLRDLYCGSLLWGAVGDALGRPAETKSPESIIHHFGSLGLTEYQKWHGWQSGPIGTITDDTQLTVEIARSLWASGGSFDPSDFVERLIAWLPTGRGKGRSTTVAVKELERGVPWHDLQNRLDHGGNGAPMRAAPVGLVAALDVSPRRLVRDSILSAVPTHADGVAVAGTIAIAAGVAYCVRAALGGAERIETGPFVEFVASAIAGIERKPTKERKPEGKLVFLVDRIRELPDLLTWPEPKAVFHYTYNGALSLESVPAAIYCFLRSPDDPRRVILTAVNAGHDADSVASMAGNLAGAWRGAEVLRKSGPTWWAELEYRDELVGLADGLAELARERTRDAGSH